MKISELCTDIRPIDICGPDAEVTGLFCDSRGVLPGGLFFALRGETADGHRYIDQALARGARAVVLEEPRSLPEDVCGIRVKNAREAMAHIAAAFHGDPSAGLPVVGVTGTNGKTTVTYLVEALLVAAGRRPAVFGTVNYRGAGEVRPASHTTPESLDLIALAADFRRRGCDSMVLEASSHALAQHRVDGIHFSVGVFTNLTSEHLDYHGDIEGYFTSKRRLFTDLLRRCEGRPVINVDDPFGARLACELRDSLTCGDAPQAMVRAQQVVTSLDGIEALVETPVGSFRLRSRLVGAFNLQNLLCAVAAGVALGLPLESIASGLSRAETVPGRMERIESGGRGTILVDYAHTGDALDKALATIQGLSPRRILTVFGCGGDRDRTKRPEMGRIAVKRSDLAIVTDDNPRSEDPGAIIEEIRRGADAAGGQELSLTEARTAGACGYVVVPDRREAIGLAVSLLGADDVLLVAGKGHEDYQIIGERRLHFDDREEVRRAVARLEAGS